jgi:sulfur carrier protein
MELKINNQTKQFRSDSLTVQTLLDLKFLKQNGIAIAINNTIIPKQNWHLHYLNETDDILIISATRRLTGCSYCYKSAGKNLKHSLSKASSSRFSMPCF